MNIRLFSILEETNSKGSDVGSYSVYCAWDVIDQRNHESGEVLERKFKNTAKSFFLTFYLVYRLKLSPKAAVTLQRAISRSELLAVFSVFIKISIEESLIFVEKSDSKSSEIWPLKSPRKSRFRHGRHLTLKSPDELHAITFFPTECPISTLDQDEFFRMDDSHLQVRLSV